MPLGNGQTQQVAQSSTQSSAQEGRCVGSCLREEQFTLAKVGDHWGGENFFRKYLKDLGT